jgi:uncharacterized protein (TIGR02147 family)
MSDYCFESFKDFFEYNLKNRETVSLNELAKKLGYNSPSLLSMIATGKRLPSSEILENLFNEWKIENSLREIIRLKLDLERKNRKNKPTGNLVEKLAKLDKKSVFKTIDLDTFTMIKEWHHLVIQQLMTSPNFDKNPILISQQLRKKITPSQAKKAISVLEKIAVKSGSETSHDVPSEAIREHHRGMLHRALEALDEQNVDERHFNSLTLKFSSDKKPAAKAAILNFVREFNQIYADEKSESVHQLNIQFFEHTQDITQ